MGRLEAVSMQSQALAKWEKEPASGRPHPAVTKRFEEVVEEVGLREVVTGFGTGREARAGATTGRSGESKESWGED